MKSHLLIAALFLQFVSVFCRADGGSITGFVRYNNTDSTIVSMCKVIIFDSMGNHIDSTYTQLDGSYSLSNIPIGTFNLKAYPFQPWGGVNTTDALMTAQHFVGLINLTGLTKTAADVNGSYFINSIDALLIQKRYVKQIGCFPIHDWISENKTAINSSADSLVINIRVICTGDVNGSYVPDNRAIPCPGIPFFMHGGQVYNTVQIGTQCWMRENLNIGTYVSSLNTNVAHTELSNNGIIEKYCYNNDTLLCKEYGGLYTWDEMMQYSNIEGSQGICPDGWHIPTSSDYLTTIFYLGNTVWGNKMREICLDHWISPNSNATNESGFTGLGAGGRGPVGDFGGLYHSAFFWTSTTNQMSFGGFFIVLAHDAPYVSPGSMSKLDGNPVRCLKN